MSDAPTLSEKPKPPAAGWKQLVKLLPYTGRHKGSLLVGMVFLTAMGVVGTILPLLIGAIMDCLNHQREPLARLLGELHIETARLLPFYRPSDRHTLAILCLLVVAAVGIKGVFTFWSRYILIGVSRDIEYDLRNDLLAHLLRLEPEFYVRNPTGELMSRCTNDLNQVRMVLGPGIMYTGATLAQTILAIVVMVMLSPALTLWVLLPVPLVVIAVRYFGGQIHTLSVRIQDSLAVLSARAQENLAGVRVIRAYRQEEPEIRSFDAANREYVGQNIKLILAWSMFMPALSTLIGASFLLVMTLGGWQTIRGLVSVGEWIAFYQLLFQLIFPMIAVGWVTNIFQRGAASMGRLAYILEAEPKISDARIPPEMRALAAADGNGRHAALEIRGEIEFRDLTFSYPAANGSPPAPVLEEVSLRIPAGSTLAIVGPTGSGKSTLAGLVARFWEAPPGTVFLDGRAIFEWPVAQLRRSIGFVPQDTFLFSDTLAENISFGMAHPDLPLIREAAAVASLTSDVEGFPAGFDTMVGERGITLSGGQKQRTALARAVLRNPKILILDDALSSVDTDTEEKILQRLKDLMRHRTTILISHRCSTVRHADQIVVLKDGRILERGTHDALLALGGYYSDLYQKQLLEEELERA